MVDSNAIFREWLTTSPGADAILALVPAAQIIAGDLPESAAPQSNQQWITFRTRGGFSDPEVAITQAHFELTCWSGDGPTARSIYRAVFDLVHGKTGVQLNSGFILAALEQIAGQDLTDPNTYAALVVCYFDLTLRV
jgi:hypothetical protein